jgi:FkbM family methyltransferase
MTADLQSLGGLARSLVIYRARPWKIARLARFYRGFIRPGDLAFDIGAHVGNRTRALLRAGARVVALEPQRLFHAFLSRDLPSSATLLPLAAGRTPGRATLAVSRLHPTVSSLATGFAERMQAAPGFERVAWDAAEIVEVTTLDRLIAEHGLPRFVKIDVEGAEAEVVAGLSQPVAWVAFESLPAGPEATAACLDRLAELGRYRFNLVEGERADFALDRWLDRAAIAAALAARPPRARSADVYARLDAG